jgi:hypothetical protein
MIVQGELVEAVEGIGRAGWLEVWKRVSRRFRELLVYKKIGLKKSVSIGPSLRITVKGELCSNSCVRE